MITFIIFGKWLHIGALFSVYLKYFILKTQIMKIKKLKEMVPESVV